MIYFTPRNICQKRTKKTTSTKQTYRTIKSESFLSSKDSKLIQKASSNHPLKNDDQLLIKIKSKLKEISKKKTQKFGFSNSSLYKLMTENPLQLSSHPILQNSIHIKGTTLPKPNIKLTSPLTNRETSINSLQFHSSISKLVSHKSDMFPIKTNRNTQSKVHHKLLEKPLIAILQKTKHKLRNSRDLDKSINTSFTIDGWEHL